MHWHRNVQGSSISVVIKEASQTLVLPGSLRFWFQGELIPGLSMKSLLDVGPSHNQVEWLILIKGIWQSRHLHYLYILDVLKGKKEKRTKVCRRRNNFNFACNKKVSSWNMTLVSVFKKFNSFIEL